MNDDDLKQALRETRKPSAEHDEAIMAAARQFANERSGRRSARWSIPVALAASVALAVFFVPNLLDRGTDGLRGSADAVDPAHRSELSAPPEKFTWPAAVGATAYTVSLRDAAANEIWRSNRVTEPRVVLPADVIAILERDVTYIWMVEVSGSNRGELGPWWFRLETE